MQDPASALSQRFRFDLGHRPFGRPQPKADVYIKGMIKLHQEGEISHASVVFSLSGSVKRTPGVPNLSDKLYFSDDVYSLRLAVGGQAGYVALLIRCQGVLRAFIS